MAIASWRSETLHALAHTKKLRRRCEEQCIQLNNSLFEVLSKSLPVLFSGMQTRFAFYEQVLLPAVRLANKMRLSTSDFLLLIPDSLTTTCKPVTMESLKMHKMVDIKSGRQLKPDSAVAADKDGVIGKIVICLEPDLRRIIKGKVKTLLQGTFLVELNHPLGKRVKTSA